MKVKSIRMSAHLERAIDYISKNEKIERTNSLRKLAEIGFEYYIAKSYEVGKLTLREVAKLLDLTLSEAIDLLAEMGIKGNIRAHDVMDSLKSIQS